jgi:DNA modification methylase
MSSRVILGDCLEAMRELADSSINAVVTDPPYGVGFMGHEWDQPGEYGPVAAEDEPVALQGGKRRRRQPSAESGAGSGRTRRARARSVRARSRWRE